MDMLLLVGILLLNVLISILNCYVVGSTWKDAVTMGTWFHRAVLRSAVVQSGVGFSMPILLLLAFGTAAYSTAGTEPIMTQAEAKEFLQVIFNLWYVAVILPIIGTGFIIWAHSLREAYRRRDFVSIAAAGWNSYAQISNTLSAVNNLGGAMSNVGEFFGKAMSGKGDGKGKFAILVLLVVVIALIAGFMIAFGLVRYFANRADSRIEQFGREHARA